MALTSDEDILSAIFNPEFPLGLGLSGSAVGGNTASRGAAGAPSSHGDVTEEERALRAKEGEGARCAEQGRLEEALCIFTEVIGAEPTRASGYNNRAQVLQLMGRLDDALGDLDKALSLPSVPGDVARKAYFQRAMVKRVKGDDDGARRDFEGAARLGDELAKREAAKLNPYAAMCNQMLASVMSTMKKQGSSCDLQGAQEQCQQPAPSDGDASR